MMTDTDTWKITTINVKGINETSKFDDLMEWIMDNDMDITIVTETKMNPINAAFKFQKYQKKYISFWDLDDGAPKGSGIGIITKKDTIGKHIYAKHIHLGRFINIRLKLKGKKDISISGVYANADASDRNTKGKIVNLIKSHIYTSPGKLNIVAGDFNEDPSHHTRTDIIDLLDNSSLHHIASSDPDTYTWSNHEGTRRVLDHMYMSEELLMVKCYTDIVDTSQYFRTDHKAVMNTICISHITNLPGNARRKTRRKKNHSEDVLDNKHNILTH